MEKRAQNGLHYVSLPLDPLIARALEAMARESGQSRVDLIRNILYTAIYMAQKEHKPIDMRIAPQYPTQDPNPGRRRLMPDPKISWAKVNVQVDDYGLVVEGA